MTQETIDLHSMDPYGLKGKSLKERNKIWVKGNSFQLLYYHPVTRNRYRYSPDGNYELMSFDYIGQRAWRKTPMKTGFVLYNGQTLK